MELQSEVEGGGVGNFSSWRQVIKNKKKDKPAPLNCDLIRGGQLELIQSCTSKIRLNIFYIFAIFNISHTETKTNKYAACILRVLQK